MQSFSLRLRFAGHPGRTTLVSPGRNLDALWDVLSADIEGPIEVLWDNPESSRLVMGRDFDRILAVLKDVEKARKDFRVRLRK